MSFFTLRNNSLFRPEMAFFLLAVKGGWGSFLQDDSQRCGFSSQMETSFQATGSSFPLLLVRFSFSSKTKKTATQSVCTSSGIANNVIRGRVFRGRFSLSPSPLCPYTVDSMQVIIISSHNH